jgi:hypothetical protein
MAGTQEARQEPSTEGLGLFYRLKCQCVLLSTLDRKKVRDAAKRQHQGIVGNRSAVQQDLAIRIVSFIHNDLAPLAIDSSQSAALEAVVIPLCMSRIFNLMARCVDLARRNFMQQGLPEVSRIPVDEYYTARRSLPTPLPSRVASSSPAAPPPTMTMR